ncbi:MAG: ATP-binding protein [Flavobacteriales bacterium]|nr:ATP-binding protein [Flavobacteriales bacterium]
MRGFVRYILLALGLAFVSPNLKAQEVVFADSLEFETFLQRLHSQAASQPDSNMVLTSQALNVQNTKYPILFAELFRQHLSAALYAERREELKKDINFWLAYAGGENADNYLAKSLSGIQYRMTAYQYEGDTLEFLIKARDRFIAQEVKTQPYYNLILTTIDRALIQGYSSIGRYDLAVEMSIEILNFDIPELYRESAFYDQFRIGILYHRMGDFDSAKEFFQRAVDEVGEIDNGAEREIYAKAWHFIGIIAREKGDTTTWISHTEQAVELFEEHNSPNAANPLLDLADYYLIRGEEDKAVQYAERAETTSWVGEKYPEYRRANILLFYSRLNYDKGNLDKAIELALEAVEYDKDRHVYEQLIPYVPNLLAESGDFKSAYEFSEKFQEEYSSFINLKSVRSIERSRRLNELQKKETQRLAEREVLQTKLAQEEERSSFERTILILAVALILLLIFIMARVLFSRSRLSQMNDQLSEQAEELIIARDKATRASRVKTDFLSVMSHEIRTPLNGIIGMNRELMKEAPRGDQVEKLQMVASASKHLLDLLNDILDFNKLNEGRIELNKNPVSIYSFLDAVVNMAKAMGARKELKIIEAFDSDLPNYLMIDDLRLMQVMSNLVSNAVKFTPNGSITIKATMNQSRLDLSVIDTGIGIPVEKQHSIFDAYTQASNATTRTFGGTGLGLSISRGLVELMNGHVTLNSEAGVGSTFSISLPVEEVIAPDLLLEEEDAKQGEFSDCKFLIAEDNELNQAVIGAILKRWRVMFDIATDGVMAVEMAENGDYDLVLMDIQMPKMDGMDATRAIRSSNKKNISKLPIIALTASALPEEVEAMKAAGMDEHVLKPIDTSKLVSAIRSNLAKVSKPI